MIDIRNLTKRFGPITAVNDVSLLIEDEQVFGLVGTNGAGKSTLMRLISGILRQDAGSIEVSGQPVYDNPEVRQNIFFIPDDPYFFRNGSAEDMRDFYRTVYPDFDSARFDRLLRDFSLDPKRRVQNYSRGMKKQLAVLCGLCSNAAAKFFSSMGAALKMDPTKIQVAEFWKVKGDPLARALRNKFKRAKRFPAKKFQCVFSDEADAENALSGLELLNHDIRGRLHTLTIRAAREEILSRFEKLDMIFFELLPLTLEEIFISETEVIGYDIKNFILN